MTSLSPVSPGRARPAALILIAVLLLALNLRLSVTSLGVLLPQIRLDLGLSGTAAGLLNALPTLVFAGAGLVTPVVAARVGLHRLVLIALLSAVAGQLLRVAGPAGFDAGFDGGSDGGRAGGTVALFAGTLLTLTGLAAGNVLLPGLVRLHFPDRITTVTGVYVTVLSVGATAAAGLSIPLQDAVGGTWRTGLSIWTGVTVVAVLPWLLVVRNPAIQNPVTQKPDNRAPDNRAPDNRAPDSRATATQSPTARGPGSGASRRTSSVPVTSLRRNRLAWAMAGFFALQAAQIYVGLGWFSEVLLDAGISEVTMGALLAMPPAIAIGLSLAVPMLIRRQSRIPYLIATFGLSYLIGYLGLLIAPASAPWVWLFFVGLGGGTFSTVLTLVALRARTPDGVIALSAFTQCLGYLLASTGPLAFGLLHDLGPGWEPSLILMIVSLVPMVGLGLLLARSRFLEDELAG